MDKEALKQRIVSEIDKTRKAIEGYESMSEPIAPDAAIGRVSRMDAINNKSVVEAALREATLKLGSLNQQLAKVDDPDFGQCLRCKQPIPIGRLLIRPESVYCVHCAR